MIKINTEFKLKTLVRKMSDVIKAWDGRGIEFTAEMPAHDNAIICFRSSEYDNLSEYATSAIATIGKFAEQLLNAEEGDNQGHEWVAQGDLEYVLADGNYTTEDGAWDTIQLRIYREDVV